VDGLWTTKSEGVALIVRAISFQDFQPICDPDPPTSQTDRQTDGRTDRQTTCNCNTALCTRSIVHGAVKSNSVVLVAEQPF